MKTSVIVVLIASFATSAYSQGFFDRITLIETFDQTFKKNEPAVFSLTVPDTAASTYQVQAALGVAIYSSSTRNVNVLYEWHQNTQLDKIQNTRQFGFAFTAVRGINSATSWDVNAALKWSHDMVKQKKSINATVLVSPYFKSGNGWFGSLWNWMSFDDIHQPAALYPSLSRWIQYTHTVSIGVDYVNFFDAQSERELGGIGMGHLEYGAHVYLLPGIFLEELNNEQFLDFYYIGITRPELFNNTDERKNWRNFQKFGASISFKRRVSSLKEREVKLAFERVLGEDVLKGLTNQKYSQIALKLRL